MMKAFVMMPFDAPSKTVYEVATEPAARECGLQCETVDGVAFCGSVSGKIQAMIRDSSICIADLTGANPNVLYEAGMARDCGKPVVFILRGRIKDLPFDIADLRVISYEDGESGLARLRHELVQTISKTLKLDEHPVELIRQLLVPSSIRETRQQYVVAASPLSYREAFRLGGGWLARPLGTYSDQTGIRGLMQAFGHIFKLDVFPDLLDPDDFDNDPKKNDPLAAPCHLYCIGSPKCNWLTERMMERFFEKRDPKWYFRPEPDSHHLRNPAILIRKDCETYRPANDPKVSRRLWDYGLVIRGPHPSDSSFMVTIMAGRSARGTEAACLAMTDQDCAKRLYAALTGDNTKVDPSEHRQAFCAVVSVWATNRKEELGPDKASFRVEDIVPY